MPTKGMRLRKRDAVFVAGGFIIGSLLTARGLLDLVAGAYGQPREEVRQQIEWYLKPVEETLTIPTDGENDTLQ